MLALTTIDLGDLDRVSGGQSRSTNGEATVSTPGGSATVRAGQTTTEPNAYLRCLDLVGRQAGVMESPNNVERRQQALCPLSLADK
ncbi:MAG TPA: hypothetical protein VKB80_06365 [Kofleriaceae bacterium]|nr:hypothetical protein [Kofleriaceae bacterium]